MKGPTRTSGATTVTLSTAMALTNRYMEDELNISTLRWTKRITPLRTLDSGDQFPYRNGDC